jgi:hypothetical protein
MASNDLQIIPLFAIPLGKIKLSRSLTENEIIFLESKTVGRTFNIGNTVSPDNFILDNIELIGLKKDLLDAVNVYVQQIINPKYDVKFYITQSWMNIADPGQYHHRHFHTNSILSCVFYINVDEKNNTIKFYNSSYSLIDIEPKEYNIYNHQSWVESLEINDILIFPSHLSHEVAQNQSSNPRISLSFNLFCKGVFGEKEILNYLELK